MDIHLPLFGRQKEILTAPHPEVLAAGDGGGKSHALRIAAIDYALAYPGIHVVLYHPRQDELSRDHLEGRSGLKAMLAPLSAYVQVGPEGASFPNGSRITWLGADRPADQRRLTEAKVDLMLVDAVHRLPRELYESLVVKMEVVSGRIIAASTRLPDAGWVAERFGVDSPHHHVVETSVLDLPSDLQAVAAEPTLDEHMDGLGFPFLAAGSSFRQKPYVQKIVDVLQRWYWGELPARLFIFISTQHGKTLIGVRVFASYFLRCRPQETVGIACHAATPARHRNRDVRDFFTASGGSVGKTVDQDFWLTSQGGGSWAVGVGAGAGNPATLLINDDLDKDPKASRSVAQREAKDDWYDYVWLGREAKTGTRGELMLLGVATRLWSSDTPSRIIRYHAGKGERVHVLALPALYDPRVSDHYEEVAPGMVTVEPDFRTEEREPIDPEQHDREHWESIEGVKPHVFASRDQQKPLDAGGGAIFAESWPIDIAVDPAFRPGAGRERDVYFRPVRAWDFAGTEGGGHYTACVKFGEVKESGRIVLRHAARARYGPRGVLRFAAAMMLLDGPEVDIVIPDDPAAGGRQQTDRVTQYLSDVCRRLRAPCEPCRGMDCPTCGGTGTIRFRRPRIRSVPVKGADEHFEDFAARAQPVSDHVEGFVDYVRSEWRPTLSGSIPWLRRATEALDGTWREEFREIEVLAHEVVDANARWWVELFSEWHLFPNADYDDWTSAASYGWSYLSGPRSVYPT